jgi:hypothetical protein
MLVVREIAADKTLALGNEVMIKVICIGYMLIILRRCRGRIHIEQGTCEMVVKIVSKLDSGAYSCIWVSLLFWSANVGS